MRLCTLLDHSKQSGNRLVDVFHFLFERGNEGAIFHFILVGFHSEIGIILDGLGVEQLHCSFGYGVLDVILTHRLLGAVFESFTTAARIVIVFTISTRTALTRHRAVTMPAEQFGGEDVVNNRLSLCRCLLVRS